MALLTRDAITPAMSRAKEEVDFLAERTGSDVRAQITAIGLGAKAVFHAVDQPERIYAIEINMFGGIDQGLVLDKSARELTRWHPTEEDR